MIKLKRVYDPPAATDGMRFLVERLWPRGIKKVELIFDHWLKEVAPSTDLRKWFAHDPAKWKLFQEKYHQELNANEKAWKPIIEALGRGPVTLLYSSKDTEHNSALCLKNYLSQSLKEN